MKVRYWMTFFDNQWHYMKQRVAMDWGFFSQWCPYILIEFATLATLIIGISLIMGWKNAYRNKTKRRRG